MSSQFLNVLFYPAIFQETPKQAGDHLHAMILSEGYGPGEGPDYFLAEIDRTLANKELFKKDLKQSVVSDRFSEEEAWEILHELRRKLENPNNKPFDIQELGSEKEDAVTPFGVGLLLIPALMVGAHLFWPENLILGMLANFAVLASGGLILGAIPYYVAKQDGFILHVGKMILLIVLGGVLFYQFGWLSTVLVLIGYALLGVVTGLMMRFKIRQ